MASMRASETPVMMLSMFCGHVPRGYIQFLPRILHFSAVHYFITGKYPFFGRADILEQTKIEVVPDQPIDYCWEGRGFKVHIPAGAISTKGSVTATVRTSLGGEYELPEDSVLVSGVYWLSLDPPVERFTEKVTLTLQHCAPDDDSALTFITSTQDEPPYTFQSLPGGSFSESGYGTIDVQHFCPFGVIGRRKMYAFCTYYLLTAEPNAHEVRITVTPNLELHLKVYTLSVYVYKHYPEYVL